MIFLFIYSLLSLVESLENIILREQYKVSFLYRILEKTLLIKNDYYLCFSWAENWSFFFQDKDFLFFFCSMYKYTPKALTICIYSYAIMIYFVFVYLQFFFSSWYVCFFDIIRRVLLDSRWGRHDEWKLCLALITKNVNQVQQQNIPLNASKLFFL